MTTTQAFFNRPVQEQAMPRARIERGGFVYPLSDVVGDPEDAEGWSAESDDEFEPLYRNPSFAPDEPVREGDPAGHEADEAWSGRRAQRTY